MRLVRAHIFRTFYIRRAYRILPLYALVLIAAFVVELHYRGLVHPEWVGSEIAFSFYVLFLQNVWMAARETFKSPLLGATWSLAVEEQFYLTLPAVVRYTQRHVLCRILVGAVVAAPLLRLIAMRFLEQGWMASYVLTPCRADSLCLGALVALASRNPAIWTKFRAHRSYIYSALGLSGLGIAGVLVSQFQPFTARFLGAEYSLLAMFYVLLLMSTLLSPKLAASFSFAPLRFMGVIAYGVYLLHEPLIGAFRRAGRNLHPANPGITMLVSSSLAVALTVGLAALSWEYFEKPLVNRGHQYRYVMV